MTDVLMSNAASPLPTIREPATAEVERARYVLSSQRFPRECKWLVAVHSRPIEHFIAAAAWWPEAKTGFFQIGCRPGVDKARVAGSLLDRLEDCARIAGMEIIQCASLLAEENPWLGILREHGFACSHSERSFEVGYQDAWNRVMRLCQKHASQFPPGWRIESIRLHSPETVLDVIAAHRLLPPAEIREYWQAHSQFGFDLGLSCIFFDGARPCGAFLGRRMGDIFYVDVHVIQETNPRLRSLGNLFMMQRLLTLHGEAQQAGTDVPIRWLRFRSGATEHRETASLALRMGGRELARAHLMTKAL